MTQRYPLKMCAQLLHIDYKTFQNWLVQASIHPAKSKADSRVQYLTREQLILLAQEHERVLHLEDQEEKPDKNIPQAMYKLLVDRLEELQQKWEKQHQTDQHEIINLKETVSKADTYQNELADTLKELEAEISSISAKTDNITIQLQQQQMQLEQIGERYQKGERKVTALADSLEQQQQASANLFTKLEYQVQLTTTYRQETNQANEQLLHRVNAFMQETNQASRELTDTINTLTREQYLHRQSARNVTDALSATLNQVEQHISSTIQQRHEEVLAKIQETSHSASEWREDTVAHQQHFNAQLIRIKENMPDKDLVEHLRRLYSSQADFLEKQRVSLKALHEQQLGESTERQTLANNLKKLEALLQTESTERQNIAAIVKDLEEKKIANRQVHKGDISSES